MSIIAIAAVDADWGIGYNGQLLEHIPEDMKFFKEKTAGKIVVMGKKTQETLPNKKLANRINLVLTSKELSDEEEVYYIDYDMLDEFLMLNNNYEISYKHWQSFIDKVLPEPQDIYIIGGASIYKQLLPYCDKAYITKIYKSHENVDSYFPNLDSMNEEWALVEESSPASYKDFYYSFATYQRI